MSRTRSRSSRRLHGQRTLVAAALLLSLVSATSTAASPVAPFATLVDPANFGANGTDDVDDTRALQAALDSLRQGQTLFIGAGQIYRHRDVLHIDNAGVRVSGPGTLLATEESRSAVKVRADDVTLDGGLKIQIKSTTRRWDAPEQHKLVLLGDGDVVRAVAIDGAAAAGIFIQGASNYFLEDVSVQNARADGIHNTFGAHDGIIRRATVRDVGDDGIAVVSYQADGSPVHDVRIESPRFYGNSWGRGYSVVGGHDITFTDVYADRSHGAAIYVAVEGEWNTYSTARVQVSDGTLRNSNVSNNGESDQGAILVYNSRRGYTIKDVTFRGLRIVNTRISASRQLSVLDWGRGTSGVVFSGLRVLGGGNLFGYVNQPGYQLTDIKVDGGRQADETG